MRSIREWSLTHWLIALGVFTGVLLLAALVYVLLSPQAFVPPTQEPTQPGGPTEGLPPEVTGPPIFPPSPVEQIPLDQVQGLDTTPTVDIVARGGITQISTVTNFPVDHITLGPSGSDLNYYDPESRRFYRVQSDGTISQISGTVFAEVDNVYWAGNSTEAVVEFPDGSNVVYNFDTDEQVTLPAHWEDFDFSPDNNNLAFKSIALDPAERWLAVASKTGSQARRIEPLGENGDIVDVDWSPNNQIIATYDRPSGLDSSELYFVGTNKENFPLSKLHGLNFEGTWAPDGNHLLYSVSHQDDNLNPRLWFISGSGRGIGQDRKSLSLNTWSYKCTFADSMTAYCGVPTTLPRGSGLIPSVANDIPDELYRVDLSTGRTSRLAVPETTLNVQSLQVSEDGSELFIHDRFTGEIKSMRLEEL